MTMVRLKKNNLKIQYDALYDLIEVYAPCKNTTDDYEVEPGFYISKDEFTEEVCGFTLFDFIKRPAIENLPFKLDYNELKKAILFHS